MKTKRKKIFKKEKLNDKKIQKKTIFVTRIFAILLSA